MFCTKCAHPLEEGNRFCNECGAPVPVDEKSAAYRQTEESPPAGTLAKRPSMAGWTISVAVITSTLIAIGAYLMKALPVIEQQKYPEAYGIYLIHQGNAGDLRFELLRANDEVKEIIRGMEGQALHPDFRQARRGGYRCLQSAQRLFRAALQA